MLPMLKIVISILFMYLCLCVYSRSDGVIFFQDIHNTCAIVNAHGHHFVVVEIDQLSDIRRVTNYKPPDMKRKTTELHI